jgi:hypothetical protein
MHWPKASRRRYTTRKHNAGRAICIARKWGEIKYNVAVDTEVPQVIQRKPPSLTEGQLDRLLDVISGDPLETLILVALGTGAHQRVPGAALGEY